MVLNNPFCQRESMSDIDQKISPFEEFAKELETIQESAEQLRFALNYMKDTLNSVKPPYFKGFWEARKLCFPLFKGKLDVSVRAELWQLYTELTREGREMKNMLDQETSFAIEQIDLAIASLEKDLASAETPPLQLPKKIETLEANLSIYCERQGELNALNRFASRVNALRKELSKTEMRVRHKNKFFQRLSTLGDSIFPKRKELIREISEMFEADVTAFEQHYFSEQNFCKEQAKRQLFFFRDEIKQLQSAAKLFTINTHAFSSTRERLSACWDKLKGLEKELKRDFAHKKGESSENVQQLMEQIASFESAGYELDEAKRRKEEIAKEMKRLFLTKEDVLKLKAELTRIFAPFEAQITEQEQKQKEAFEQQRTARLEKLSSLQQRFEQLKAVDLDQLKRGLEECRTEISALPKSDRLGCEKGLRELKDLLAQKQEEVLLSLSDDARSSLDSLESFLHERREQRREIKERLEEYRKAVGGSALDIEKAMELGELAEAEKERLAKCDQAIFEVEQKIELIKQQ
ncbi:MAG: hypothetical protein S4CHLAM81_06090 [Chlamydiales bacterium]|nr:hypothetical protein [Chlamydiales bacterium]MCH9635393.1 hypothetical protein [Chlamydiales bacterium]